MSIRDWYHGLISRYLRKCSPPAEAKPSRTYPRGACERCGELNLPLRADGWPSERWHKCRVEVQP